MACEQTSYVRFLQQRGGCRRRLENVAPGGEWRSDEERSAQMITCSSQVRLSENPISSEMACHVG
jgi:hypothetical protein